MKKSGGGPYSGPKSDKSPAASVGRLQRPAGADQKQTKNAGEARIGVGGYDSVNRVPSGLPGGKRK